MGEDGSVTAVDDRRSRIADLIGDRSLSARSVLATALLGADQPHLTVGELVGVASLFGISDGAARTCLWRMVSNGELIGDDGTYALAGPLLERRQRVDEAARIDDTSSPPWDGTWELAVVSRERRSAVDRLALRKAAPSCVKESGFGPTTSTGTACRRRAQCWTANASTSMEPRPTFPPRR
jgi:phenylacetic acid degradation operon negative regulatory protein